MIKIIGKEGFKKKLISELLNRTVPVTITELAKLINKTGRTVRSYLDELEEEFKDYGLEIVRKSNVGVYITMEEKDRLKLVNTINEDKLPGLKADCFSSRYRHNYILKTLIDGRFSYTIKMFADELYCSKSTIVNELGYVEKWLLNYNLSLRRRQNQGLWIEGLENDCRRAYKDLLKDIQDKEETFDELNVNDVELDYRIDLVDFTKIKSMFPKINLFIIQRIIQEAEKELGFYFTDQAFINLITHISITIERLRNNRTVSNFDNYYESIKDEKEYKIAKWVVEELSKEFKVRFPEEEIGYITIHMLGEKIQENYTSDECLTIIENLDAEYTDMAKEIIALSSSILNVDLSKDEGLLPRLVLHLRPTVMRLKFGLTLTNPILSRIKQEYTNIFGVAWACSSIFESKFGVTINEDEVGFLTLHLALANEKAKYKIKTVVVCSSGVGTSQLVASKLAKKFDNLEITHILPFNMLSQKISEEAELIITTIRNFKMIEKFVYISTLVNEEDIRNIENTIKRVKMLKAKHAAYLDLEADKKLGNKQEESIFDKELCYLDSEFKSFPETIKYYGKIMEEKGYAKPGFYEDILRREKEGFTYIGKGIAIPHSTDNYVNKSKICLVKFKNHISWQDNKLDFIFILCLKFSDIGTTKKFFRNFYTMLESDELIYKIKNAKSIDDIDFMFHEGDM